MAYINVAELDFILRSWQVLSNRYPDHYLLETRWRRFFFHVYVEFERFIPYHAAVFDLAFVRSTLVLPIRDESQLAIKKAIARKRPINKRR